MVFETKMSTTNLTASMYQIQATSHVLTTVGWAL